MLTCEFIICTALLGSEQEYIVLNNSLFLIFLYWGNYVAILIMNISSYDARYDARNNSFLLIFLYSRAIVGGLHALLPMAKYDARFASFVSVN